MTIDCHLLTLSKAHHFQYKQESTNTVAAGLGTDFSDTNYKWIAMHLHHLNFSDQCKVMPAVHLLNN